LNTETIEISVTDFGIGIALEQQLSIFQPFTQADNTTSRRFGGTGLGLSLVRAFVSMHRGILELESTLGKGSTFKVFLPRDTRLAETKTESRVEAIQGGGECVLVLSRRAEMLAQACDELVAGGYQAARARKRSQAARLIRKARPAALVLKLAPPRFHGWEALNWLKMHGRAAGIPVVLSAYMDQATDGVALAGDDYFPRSKGIPRMVARLGQMAPPVGAEALRLLIISDDEDLQGELWSRLKPFGFRIDQARSVDRGVERAAIDTPALIVLDLMLEQMGGLEVALRLRSQPRTISIPRFFVGREELTGNERHRLTSRLEYLARSFPASRHLTPVVRDLLARQLPNLRRPR
jgi:DNA-binding response OmpR family regulator